MYVDVCFYTHRFTNLVLASSLEAELETKNHVQMVYLKSGPGEQQGGAGWVDEGRRVSQSRVVLLCCPSCRDWNSVTKDILRSLWKTETCTVMQRDALAS